jgi:DUF1365 family protein
VSATRAGLVTRPSPFTTADLPALPALVVGSVHHTRHQPIEHSFDYRHYQWLIDLDAPPQLPRWLRPLATFSAEDHLSGPATLAALKDNVQRVIARHGVDSAEVTRVVMLAHARVLGHAFDPMTLFWCFGPDGIGRAVLVEVHNTYGGRHAYVITPDASGRASTAKAFYVSPFNDTAGEYAIHLHLTPQRVAASIRLHRDGRPVVTAAVDGVCRTATPRALLATFARNPFMPQLVSVLIRIHGIWLWMRRLPVRERPAHRGESVR